MSIKSTIENHPVVVFGTAMVLGFSAFPTLLAVFDRTTISRSELQALQVSARSPNPNQQTAINNPNRYDFTEGYFARTNEGWIEQKNNQVLPFTTWKELNVDKDFIYLSDSGRKMILRLPLKGGISAWAYESSPNAWNQLTTVQPR